MKPLEIFRIVWLVLAGMLLLMFHFVKRFINGKACHEKPVTYNIQSFLFLILVFVPSLSIVWMGCSQRERTPRTTDSALQTPLIRLLSGNDHFAHQKPLHPDEDIQHLKEVAKEQHPFAVVVCCSDSRVSPELVFDQGIGDLFVIRTAGNVIGGIELGSIEYAVEHLGVKLIVVMGHENCGAIKAFVDGGELPGHIKDIVDSLKEESEINAIPADDLNRVDDCVKANVLHGVKQLQTQSLIIREKLHNKELEIVGARYDLDDFKVELLKQ